jgi:hypothetical protein
MKGLHGNQLLIYDPTFSLSFLFFTSEISVFRFSPLYDRYLLHFIYEKEEEDLLNIATIDYKKKRLKLVIF